MNGRETHSVDRPGEGDPRRERLLDLLADRATVGLSAAEEAELQLLTHDLGERIDESLERAAARLSLSVVGRPATYGAMPADLFQKLVAAGDEWSRASVEPVNFGAELPSLMEGLIPERPVVVAKIGFWPRARKTWPTWGGWVAAAASLSFAFLVSRPPSPVAPVATVAQVPAPARAVAMAELPIQTRIEGEPVLARHEVESAVPVLAVAVASPVEGLDRLVEAEPDVLKVSAVATSVLGEQSANVEAEFTWSESARRGFLTVAGLPPTDASRQYQVWVRDGERAEPHPINGGLFDIASDGPRWVIPIEPRLTVFRPAGFEVTTERAGGVVISSPDRVVLSAAVLRAEDLVGPPSSLATNGVDAPASSD